MQRDLSAVSNGMISCDINCWLVVISLPRRHLEYVVLSNLFAAYKNILSWGLTRLKNRIAMGPNMKGFTLLTRAINDDISSLAPDKYPYVLNSSICRGCPGELCKKNSVVLSFPDELWSEKVNFSWPVETVVTVTPTLSKYFEIAASSVALPAVLLANS